MESDLTFHADGSRAHSTDPASRFPQCLQVARAWDRQSVALGGAGAEADSPGHLPRGWLHGDMGAALTLTARPVSPSVIQVHRYFDKLKKSPSSLRCAFLSIVLMHRLHR